MNAVTANAIERRLFIVVGGGLYHNVKGRLGSDICDCITICGDEHPRLEQIRYLLIVKSMADAAALIRQWVQGNDGVRAFHSSAAVIVIRNQALEFVNRKWAATHYGTLQDHMPFPVIFPKGATAISINFDGHLGQDGSTEKVWQYIFPGWKDIRDVDSEAWLNMLPGRHDVSIHRISRDFGPELKNALVAASDE